MKKKDDFVYDERPHPLGNNSLLVVAGPQASGKTCLVRLLKLHASCTFFDDVDYSSARRNVIEMITILSQQYEKELFIVTTQDMDLPKWFRELFSGNVQVMNLSR